MARIDYEIPLSYYAMQPDGFFPVFRFGNYVLVERFTGKTYLYRGVNLATREVVRLFYKKNRLTVKEHTWATKKIISITSLEADHLTIPCQKTELSQLIEKNRVIFSHILPRYGYGVRKKQIELSEQMLRALHDNSLLLSEAAVGIGKTHAYLIAAVFHKLARVNDFRIRNGYGLSLNFGIDTPMPVIISTSSIALQQAITRDYIPEISRILLENRLINRPLTSVIRKGKEHYVCEKRLHDYLPYANDKTRSGLISLSMCYDTAPDLNSIDYLTSYDKLKICVDENCNYKCPRRESCHYLASLKDMQSGRHDFQVCNHQYLLADLIRRTNDLNPLIPNYQAVIIDEAHRLEQAAQTMYGTEVSSREVPALARKIESLSLGDKRLMRSLRNYCDKLTAFNDRLFAALTGVINSSEVNHFKMKINAAVRAIIRNLRQYLDTVHENLSNDPGVPARQMHIYINILYELQRLSERLRTFQRSDEIVPWLEMPEITRGITEEISLCCIPKNLGKHLYSDLWSKQLPVILTSGTLATAGSFDYIKKRIGLDLIAKERISEVSKPSPFDYMNNCLLYISEKTPFPDNRNKDYFNAVTDEITCLVTATHGHTAVLFTSYRVMELVYQIINKQNLGYPLFRLNRSGNGALERFKEAGNGILFASGSLWEGIDIPGDVLSSLIIVKLPFQVPDPLNEHERSAYASDYEYKQRVILPDMLLKLKQGFGRILRRESDTGVVSILDARVRFGGNYRQAVLRALPHCRVTNSISEVQQFVVSVKSAEYFQKEKQ